MKKILFVCFMIFALSFLWSCTPENENKSVRTIHGKAAIGAYIEEGAQVQVRPASVDGVNPANLIEGTVGADGYYEVVIPEEIPEVSDPEIITKSISKSPVFYENGTGFIIRVWSESAESWIYSYSENDGADTVANVNPYTDRLVRCFYNQIRVNQGNIDIYFPTGIKPDGGIMTIPTSESISKIMTTMSNILYTVYGLSDIQNALNDSWQIDLGLDQLIGSIGINKLGTFLEVEFWNLLNDPDVITNGSAIHNEIGEPVYVEIWTPYGNTGKVYMTYTDIPGGSQTVEMIKQPDSAEGNNHFKAVSTNTGQNAMPWPTVYISIDDYNDGMGFNFVMVTP